MTVSNQIAEIVRRNLDVFYEIEALDTGMRRDLDDQQRRTKSPWIMMGRTDFAVEELEIWAKLDRGEISKARAISEMRTLMASYYE